MVEKKKSKDLSWQQVLIFASLGISVVVALKMFLPKKNNGNGRQMLGPDETQAMMDYYARYASMQQLPQTPVNSGEMIPLVQTAPFIPNNNGVRSPAVSSHFEDMARQEQLDRIPVNTQVGLNGMFPQMQPTQNTVNPYREAQNRQNIGYAQVPQSIHNVNRIMRSDGETTQRIEPQVLTRQPQYSQTAGYQQVNPYASGSVI